MITQRNEDGNMEQRDLNSTAEIQFKNRVKTPEPSIIVACFNAENTIEQTIEAVIGHAFTNYEVIFIDGKSSVLPRKGYFAA